MLPFVGKVPSFKPKFLLGLVSNFDPFQKFDTSASKGVKVHNFGGPISGEPLFW